MRATYRGAVLELREPLRISRSVMASRHAVWLTVDHQGLRGHGEVVSSRRLGLSRGRLVRLLAEAGREVERYPDPESALHAWDPGELPAAVAAAAESALLDLAGKRAGAAVHELLGTPRPPSAATARTIGIVGPAHAAAQARELATAGFRVLKVKLGSKDPDDDLSRVRAVRTGAPGARLIVDPNGAWTPAAAVSLIERLAALGGVDAVEQPIAPGDPDALARLAERSALPVVADEDAAGHDDAVRLAGRVQGVNIKLAECGGVRVALRVIEALHGSGTDIMLGCLAASSLGVAPAVHLADRARWADLDGHLLLARDPWTGIGGQDGTVRAPARAGLGVLPAAPAAPAAPGRVERPDRHRTVR